MCTRHDVRTVPADLLAEAGDPVGRFNHGLNLMRGHGIAQDEALGRDFVDQAARDVDVIVNGFNPAYPDWAREVPHLTRDVFVHVVATSAPEGHRLQILKPLGAPPDHPTLPAHPEGEYLCMWQ